MNEHTDLEAELRRLKPAPAQREFMARLEALSLPVRREAGVHAPQISVAESWWRLLRWLVPVAAGVVLLIAPAIWWPPNSGPELTGPSLSPISDVDAKPDTVQVDRELVAAYDALVELPGGEPVRFRCHEWMDSVLMRDAASGVFIEQRTPRFEVVGARLDTY